MPQDKKCDDVITFDPAKLPRISTLLGEPGKLSEGKDVEGNLKQVLEKIKGSWILGPISVFYQTFTVFEVSD